MDDYTQAEAKKSNNGTKGNENEQAQICLTRWFEEEKKQARNEPKQTPRKAATRQNKKQPAK